MYEDTVNPTQINWKGDEQYAMVAFLLLSIDGKMSDEELQKLDAFMGISQMEADTNDDDWEGYHKLLAKLRTARDKIIRQGNAFLDSLERDESYCDYVVDEIDRIIEETFIPHSEASGLFSTGDGKKQHGVLFNYAKLIYADNDCSKNQKRLLRHLAQKWDVAKSALTVLENSAKALNEVDKKRDEIQNSDMPHREAVSTLTKLEAKEKAAWEELEKLYIPKEICLFGIDHLQCSVSHFGAILGFDEDIAENDDEEETFADKIGDSIVEGIYKVGDIICAPFEWMTEKLSGL